MAQLSDDNRLLVDTVDVWNCANAFEFVCPKYWDSLAKTNNPDIRHCGVCNQPVHRCATPLDFVTHAELGHCVAVPQDRTPHHGFEKHILGQPKKGDYRRLESLRKETLSWWQQVMAMRPQFASAALAEIARMLRLRLTPGAVAEQGEN